MPAAPTVWMTTLGCAKNAVDSEKIIGSLQAAGYRSAPGPEDADVVLVNTCAFIDAARRESVESVIDHAEARRPDSKLVVVGCMAQRYRGLLQAELPEADAVVPIEEYGDLVGRIDRLVGRPPGTAAMDLLTDLRRPPPGMPYAYLKVAEGCGKACTFCAIPAIRGPQRSRSPENVREEAAALCAAGATEMVLVAQDLAAFGRDTGGAGIVELLRQVALVDGLRRLRLLYLYPREITESLIDEIAGNSAIASYFDLSLQHVRPGLLRAMGRGGSGDRHLRLVERIRRADGDAALRSSFIVGFPGETEDDTEALAEFLREARLDWAGFFPFSAEEGTPAAAMPHRVPTPEVGERIRLLHEVQEAVAFERAAEQVGRVFDVVVDQVEDGVPVARSYREAPEIDGVILLDRGDPGEWLRAEVTALYGPELAARVTG